MEITNNGIAFNDKVAVTNEKLRGNFNLKLNQRLPQPKKIEAYAKEPISYYLYKKRKFFERLAGKD